MSSGGVTDERTRVKHGVVDPRLQPQAGAHACAQRDAAYEPA